jgi:membrane protease YdiL (CAAX protease family)
MGRWRFTSVWWLVVASPLLVVGLTFVGMGLGGQDLPSWSDFSMFNGLPAHGVFSTLLMVLVLNGLGEETGWRGFLQDRLQLRFKPLSSTLIVAVVWAVWHTPFFFILSTYSEFSPMTLVMFPLGLTSGAVILAWLYNHTGRSILAVALWHTFYNMSVATAGATDLVQGVVTAAVMIAASVLVTAEIVVQLRGGDSVLGPPPARENLI